MKALTVGAETLGSQTIPAFLPQYVKTNNKMQNYQKPNYKATILFIRVEYG